MPGIETSLDKDFQLTQQQLEDVQKNINHVIDSIVHNSSFFSRAAVYWGNLPIWNKIILGLLLIVPTLVIGILSHIAIIWVISIITCVVYAGAGIILDNHYALNENNTEGLKESFAKLSEALNIAINSLNLICRQIAEENQKFHDKNNLLSKQISLLNEQVTELESTALKISNTQKGLDHTLDNLTETNASLTLTLESQHKLQVINQFDIEETKKRTEENASRLEKIIQEIEKTKNTIGNELDLTLKTIPVLEQGVQDLIKLLLSNQEEQKTLGNKLEEFLKTEREEFQKTALEISRIKNQIAEAKEQIVQFSQQYKELLNREERVIKTMERTLFVGSKDSFFKKENVPCSPINNIVDHAYTV